MPSTPRPSSSGCATVRRDLAGGALDEQIIESCDRQRHARARKGKSAEIVGRLAPLLREGTIAYKKVDSLLARCVGG